MQKQDLIVDDLLNYDMPTNADDLAKWNHETMRKMVETHISMKFKIMPDGTHKCVGVEVIKHD